MEQTNNNQIAARQNNHISLTVKQQCRPLLAKIHEDFPKIRKENIQVIDGTINYLFALLNIQFKPEEKAYRDAQTLVLSEFLTDRYGNLTLEEVKQAFKMYAAKEFPDLKTFRILDCISLGEVLTAYTEKRNKELHVYSLKKLQNKQELAGFNPTAEEIKSNRIKNLELIFESLKSKKTDYSAFIYYDFLKSKGKVSKDEALELYETECAIYQNELEIEALEHPNKRFSITTILEQVKSNKWDPVIVNRTKSAAVSNYLSQFESLDVFLKEFE